MTEKSRGSVGQGETIERIKGGGGRRERVPTMFVGEEGHVGSGGGDPIQPAEEPAERDREGLIYDLVHLASWCREGRLQPGHSAEH